MPKPHTRARRIRARKASNYPATDLLAYIHEAETSPELRRYADSGASLPIVQLMFPVPKHLKATRQIRPLSTTQEDAA